MINGSKGQFKIVYFSCCVSGIKKPFCTLKHCCSCSHFDYWENIVVPVVTLFVNSNIKFLENIKQRFKKAISWNKYRSEVKTQPKITNVDYMIVPTFRLLDCLFFHLKVGKMILKEILLISVTYDWQEIPSSSIFSIKLIC